MRLSKLLRFALVSACLVFFSGLLNPGGQMLAVCVGQEAVLADSDAEDSYGAGVVPAGVAAVGTFALTPEFVFSLVEILPVVLPVGQGFTACNSSRAPPAL